MKPRISIVVPTRDTRDLTAACLRSLPPPAPGQLETIVVDDASLDGTAEAIRLEFPGVQVVRLERAGGFAVAANTGLASATGRLLFLLNSDTEIEPGCLAAIEAAFAHDPGLGVGGAELFHFDGRPQWGAGREPTAVWLFLLASGIAPRLGRIPGYRRLRPAAAPRGAVDWVSGAALVLRAETWWAVGPFDEQFRFYAQDLDLCVGARAAGWRVAVMPGARVKHHGGASVARRGEVLSGGQAPELLWPDLLRWVARRRGEAAARRARRCLLLGARLRLLARGLRAPFLPGERRAGFDEQSAGLSRARAVLTGLAAHGPPATSR